jgi:peptide/nickel transport system substrate-binding protein
MHGQRRAFWTGSVLAAALATLALDAEARTLRTNILADPAMVDPITYSELVAGDVMSNVYEGFTGIDENGEVEPALAESWEAHDDNLGYTFKLREGVKFHSGREFTANDVKYTLEQLLLPGNKAGLNAEYLESIVGAAAVKDGSATDLEGVKVIDDHTVEIRFEKPDVLFPIYPIWFMDSGIVEEQGPDWATKVSAGTGPFAFEAWNRGQNVKLTANPDYWGGGPHVDGVDFIIVPSDDTAISMFEAGELDLIYVSSVPEGRRILKDPQFEDALLKVPAAQIQYLGMNQNLYEPFKDARVREALCIAMDRDGMVNGLYGGAAFPLYGQITPGVAGYNPDLPAILHDPERAKQLMADAGYPDGEGLPPLKIATTAPNKDTAAYFASTYKNVLGLPVEIETVERATHIKAMNAGEVPFFHWGWSAGYPDALYFLSQVWYGPSVYNRSRWQNDEFDRLIEQAQAQPDNQKRYAIYQQAEQVLLDDWGTCPTTVRMQIAAVKPDVKGVHLTPFRFLPFDTVEFTDG